eukprot:1563446-Prymnesium_polylepis.2
MRKFRLPKTWHMNGYAHDPHARVIICEPHPVPGEHDPVQIICGPARGEAACEFLLLHLLDEPQQQRVE